MSDKEINISEARFKKTFKNYFRQIANDIDKLGDYTCDASVFSYKSKHQLLSRLGELFIVPSSYNAEEILSIRFQLHTWPIEILIPIGKQKIKFPYYIIVTFPTPIDGDIIYKKGALGYKWKSDYKKDPRIRDLKKVLPRLIKKHKQYKKGLYYNILVGYILQSVEGSKTELLIHSGYEGGGLTGGYRPRPLRYLVKIPAIDKLLNQWNN